jgi:hypothetical protein
MVIIPFSLRNGDGAKAKSLSSCLPVNKPDRVGSCSVDCTMIVASQGSKVLECQLQGLLVGVDGCGWCHSRLLQPPLRIQPLCSASCILIRPLDVLSGLRSGCWPVEDDEKA